MVLGSTWISEAGGAQMESVTKQKQAPAGRRSRRTSLLKIKLWGISAHTHARESILTGRVTQGILTVTLGKGTKMCQHGDTEGGKSGKVPTVNCVGCSG